MILDFDTAQAVWQSIRDDTKDKKINTWEHVIKRFEEEFNCTADGGNDPNKYMELIFHDPNDELEFKLKYL